MEEDKLSNHYSDTQQFSSDSELWEPGTFPKIQERFQQDFSHGDKENDSRSAQSNIKVMCRIRPNIDQTNNKTNFSEQSPSIFCVEDNVIHMGPPGDKGMLEQLRNQDRCSKHLQTFNMDYIFQENSTQEELFLKVGNPCLTSLFSGINSTILAYGQTGTGKTYTLLGGLETLDFSLKMDFLMSEPIPPPFGLIPRIIITIFQDINKLSIRNSFNLTISILEIYNENINDLISCKSSLKTYQTSFNPSRRISLETNSSEYKMKHSQDRFYVKDLSEHVVGSPEAALHLLHKALVNRKKASTRSNTESSRSHLIFIMDIEKKDKIENSKHQSRLCIVDLAGSEKAEAVSYGSNSFKEGKMINNSLTCLGKVINSLSIIAQDKNKNISHVPYRDSKLTQILKSSLGGDSETFFILTCSPEIPNYNESLFTLRFGQRAKFVKNRLQNASDTLGSCQNFKLMNYNKTIKDVLEFTLLSLPLWSKNLDCFNTSTLKEETNFHSPCNTSLLGHWNADTNSFIPVEFSDKTSGTKPYSLDPNNGISNIELYINKSRWEELWNMLYNLRNDNLVLSSVKSQMEEDNRAISENIIARKVDLSKFKIFQNWKNLCFNSFSEFNSTPGTTNQETGKLSPSNSTFDLSFCIDKDSIDLSKRHSPYLIPDLCTNSDSLSKPPHLELAENKPNTAEQFITSPPNNPYVCNPSIQNENVNISKQKQSNSLNLEISDFGVKTDEINHSELDPTNLPMTTYSSGPLLSSPPCITPLRKTENSSYHLFVEEEESYSNSESLKELVPDCFQQWDDSPSQHSLLNHNKLRNYFQNERNQVQTCPENIFKHLYHDHILPKHILSFERLSSPEVSNLSDEEFSFQSSQTGHTRPSKPSWFNTLSRAFRGVSNLFYKRTPAKDLNVPLIDLPELERLCLQNTRLINSFQTKFKDCSIIIPKDDSSNPTLSSSNDFSKILKTAIQVNSLLLETINDYDSKSQYKNIDNTNI